MRGIRVSAVAAVVGFLLTVGPAGAAPPPPPWPSLPELINAIVPPAPVPQDVASLRAAVMPAPVGDPFYDVPLGNLGALANGQLTTWRDVTATAAPLIGIPVRQVVQLQFRTTDAHGAPSFGTASLVIPAAPWQGPGTRPVLVNNLPIDGLSPNCNSGYTMAHGWQFSTEMTDFIPPVTALAAARGYAVLLPDHEGPHMAYAEPYVAGHVVLDAVRATRNHLPAEFGASRFAMQGYSGGSIATVGAVKLIDPYAPELRGAIVGAAVGGVPADYELLTRSMNGNLASAVLLAAVLGIGRERPEILGEMNHLAQWVATSPLKDQCIGVFGLGGLISPTLELAANTDNPLDSPVARQILRETRMSGMKSGTPMLIYNGAQDFWIPAEGARELYREQCGLGVVATYRDVPGEHVIGTFTGFPEAMVWLDQRLQGVPAPNDC